MADPNLRAEPMISEWDVTECMLMYGGSFARSIATAFRCADADNTAKLHAAFPELWEDYKKMAYHHKRARLHNKPKPTDPDGENG